MRRFSPRQSAIAAAPMKAAAERTNVSSTAVSPNLPSGRTASPINPQSTAAASAIAPPVLARILSSISAIQSPPIVKFIYKMYETSGGICL